MLLRVRTLRKGGNRIAIRPSRGAQGTSSEIHIGEVVSVPHGEPAEVVNTGTPTEAVLNFKLPVGAKGKDFSAEDIEFLETEINAKVDKVEGKQLSDNNYTDTEKTKLSGVEAGAQKNTPETDPTVPSWAKQASKPTYTIDEIIGLIEALNLKADVGEVVAELGRKVDYVEGRQLTEENYTEPEKVKLMTVEEEATHNAPDGVLVDRSNHIGTQPIETVDGLESTLEELAPKADSKGLAMHGSDEYYPRPQGFTSVEWVGSIEPINSIDGDTWIDTSAEEG